MGEEVCQSGNISLFFITLVSNYSMGPSLESPTFYLENLINSQADISIMIF